MRQLIVTGDDFGLAVPVNEAIEEAHRRGILTTASLMVGGGAAADAVARARRLPSLRVGLHLVLVEGRPVLPPQAVPALVDRRGEFSTHLVGAGVRFFVSRAARRQLAEEIRAQFAAFRATGLPLDHVNAHNHMHLHPTVLGLILKIGAEFGLKAVRWPYEPLRISWRASGRGFLLPLCWWLFLSPWLRLLRARLRRAGVRANDFVLGLHASGRMDRDAVVRFLALLPDGVTEMYFHPATRRCPEIDRTMRGYRHEAEYEALTSHAVRDALRACGARRLSFSELP